MIMRNIKAVGLLTLICLLSTSALAGEADFKAGTAIPEFGKIAAVQTDMKIPKRAKFKVLFDTTKAAKAGELNSTLTSAARFINMHVAAGVPEKNIDIAVVFHSKAAFDLTKPEAYQSVHPTGENANAALIERLTQTGVRIILCGQTAAYYDVSNDDLLPGVEMALSAMTAHALLQQDGYTLNPF